MHASVTTKTFDVLRCLVENAGEVISKDALLGEVWKGDFVEESNLPVHVSKLRKILVETPETRFIETVQGTGYRFLAPVQTVSEEEWRVFSERILRHRQASDTCLGDLSVAVIPLENETLDPAKQYLADGLTEGVINGLSGMPDLKVISRNTVFKLKEYDYTLDELKKALRVAFVVTGRVRLVDSRVTVAVEITTTEDGVQIWGNTFNRGFSDIAVIEKDIVAALGEVVTVSPYMQKPSPQENAESYKYYLMGRYFLAKRTEPEMRRGIEYFEKSLAFSETNIHSLVSLVDSYDVLYAFDCISRNEAVTKISAVLKRLVDADESLDVVQLMWGKLKLHFDLNIKEAERHVRKALKLNPNSVEGHYLLASIMAFAKKGAESESHVNQMLSLDPISLLSLKRAARVFCMLSRFEAAITYLRDACELEPSDCEALFLLGVAEAEIGDYKRSLRNFQHSYKIQPYLETLSMIGYVEALQGHAEKAKNILRRLERELKTYSGPRLHLSRIYLAIGNKEESYRLLEEAFDDREMDLVALPVDFRWKSIQSDARFKRLIRRVRKPRKTFF